MPTELYQEPTPTERALEGEIDALLRRPHHHGAQTRRCAA